MTTPKHCVEITQDTAYKLIGNDGTTWYNYERDDLVEITTYKCHGTFVFAICNWTTMITQYYIQDINV